MLNLEQNEDTPLQPPIQPDRHTYAVEVAGLPPERLESLRLILGEALGSIDNGPDNPMYVEVRERFMGVLLAGSRQMDMPSGTSANERDDTIKPKTDMLPCYAVRSDGTIDTLSAEGSRQLEADGYVDPRHILASTKPVTPSGSSPAHPSPAFTSYAMPSDSVPRQRVVL